MKIGRREPSFFVGKIDCELFYRDIYIIIYSYLNALKAGKVFCVATTWLPKLFFTKCETRDKN